MRTYACLLSILLLAAITAFAQSTAPSPAQTGSSAGAGSSTEPSSGTMMQQQRSGRTASMQSPVPANGQAKPVSRADRLFLEEQAAEGSLEVQMAKMAEQKASDPRVKQFAERVLQNAGRSTNQLSQLAADHGVNAPAGLSPIMQDQLKHLSGLSGAEFDRAYIQQMVKDREHDVSEYEGRAGGADEADIKSFAATAAPELKQQLDEGKRLERELGGK